MRLGLWTMESSPQIRAKGADSGLLPLAHATSTCQFPPPGGCTPVPDWMSVVPTSSPLWCSATGEKMVATRWATKVPTQKASKWCHLRHVPDLGNDPTWWERSSDTNKVRPWTTATRDNGNRSPEIWNHQQLQKDMKLQLLTKQPLLMVEDWCIFSWNGEAWA